MKMKTRNTSPTRLRALPGVLLALAALCLTAAPALGQATSGGTTISNTASATYSDGTNSYSVSSNTVTVTVANVAGLTITPDGGSIATVVAGKTDVDFTFTVTNSGNFATQVRFPAGGGAIFPSAGLTVTQAVIDTDGNGIDTGDIDILGNGAAVLYPSASPYLERNTSFSVVVRATVGSGVAAGTNLTVTLGDAAADNETADSTNTEVRTSVPSGVTLTGNESEGVGSVSTTVENDAQLRLSVNAPAGPVALGSNITYTYTVDNTGGARAVGTRTLVNGPTGPVTGVFAIVPVPQRTTFSSASAPAGTTVLYTNSGMGLDPLTGASWSSTAPAGVTRVAFVLNGGAALAAGGSVANLQMVVTVNTGINASLHIYGIGDAFGRNSVNTNLTDQSGDNEYNSGDANADFDEPKRGVPPAADEADDPGKGYQVPTTLTQVGSVRLGPAGAPAAVGPSSNNDDYTNKSVAPTVIDGLSHENSIPQTDLDFTNTVQNIGNADDTFTFTAPTYPTGFQVRISTDGGTNFTIISGGGSATLAVPYNSTANVIVRVTAPAGTAVLQQGGFNVVVRATSGLTPTESNDTHDNYYTGFLRLVKTVTVDNQTSVGGATDAVPGADLVYSIAYSNISSGGGGAGCVNLVASSLVITERGDVAPNNWATTTTQVTTPMPTDSIGGAASVVDEATNLAATAATVRLKDTVPGNLNPGESGTFTFRRRIKNN
jgi:hypothetical protein